MRQSFNVVHFQRAENPILFCRTVLAACCLISIKASISFSNIYFLFQIQISKIQLFYICTLWFPTKVPDKGKISRLIIFIIIYFSGLVQSGVSFERFEGGRLDENLQNLLSRHPELEVFKVMECRDVADSTFQILASHPAMKSLENY